MKDVLRDHAMFQFSCTTGAFLAQTCGFIVVTPVYEVVLEWLSMYVKRSQPPYDG